MSAPKPWQTKASALTSSQESIITPSGQEISSNPQALIDNVMQKGNLSNSTVHKAPGRS